jgi:hypothetical protein
MKSPVRWSEDSSGATDLERSVLRSEQNVEPPAGASAAVWAKLSADLGLPALVGVAAVSHTAKAELAAETGARAGSALGASAKALVPAAASTLPFLKGVNAGVVACGAVWQGQRWLSDPAATTVESAPRAASVASSRAPGTPTAPVLEGPVAAADPRRPDVAPKANERAPAPEPHLPVPPNPGSAPSVAVFGEASELVRATPEQRASQLKEEAELLRQARAQLRAGELASAFALLETSRRRFAAPELYQERESLLIELLFRSGQTAAARTRAHAFVTAYPESPHANRLKELGR